MLCWGRVLGRPGRGPRSPGHGRGSAGATACGDVRGPAAGLTPGRGLAARWPGPPVAGEADLGPDAVGDRHGDDRDRGRGFAVLAAAAAVTAGPAAVRAVISFPTTATSSGRTGQPLFGCWLDAVRAPGSHQRGYSSTTGTDQAATRFNHAALDSAASGRSLGGRPRPDRGRDKGPGLRASRRERGAAGPLELPGTGRACGRGRAHHGRGTRAVYKFPQSARRPTTCPATDLATPSAVRVTISCCHPAPVADGGQRQQDSPHQEPQVPDPDVPAQRRPVHACRRVDRTGENERTQQHAQTAVYHQQRTGPG